MNNLSNMHRIRVQLIGMEPTEPIIIVIWVGHDNYKTYIAQRILVLKIITNIFWDAHATFSYNSVIVWKNQSKSVTFYPPNW